MPPNPVVLFGNSPSSFYVGCGVRFNASNVPQSLADTVQKIPAIQLKWISMDNEGAWVARDAYQNSFHYALALDADLVAYLNGSNGNKADYITFGHVHGNHFVNHPPGWSADVEDPVLKELTGMRAQLPNFDVNLVGMIFGKGNTHLYMLKNGFGYHLDWEDSDSSELYKILRQFSTNEGWLIERGSSLSFYSYDYFYLMFKRPSDGRVEIRWRLPEEMQEKLVALRTEADTPEQALLIQQHEQANLALAVSRANVAFAAGAALNSVVAAGQYHYY